MKIAILFILGACAGRFGSSEFKLRTALTVADTAMIACDYSQTQWASNGGRWNRFMAANGTSTINQAQNSIERIEESNPLLGRTPSETTLGVAAAAGLVTTLALAYAPKLPGWARWVGLLGIELGESYVLTKAMADGIPFCGAGT